ncbi:LuxR family transcriptional regulator [Affinibrenneria salicis]|uniref:LuxR family transcriptional regulator n=1 Tax=Affinibrenneria salicis TaxID=2590031 RepID=A0A5J5FXA0_9GAMM|nr:LuxR C-terminal-related transcriptional regulator [Affinibrenneria salicis]KAA8998449.1 LuxR family transcriptional regulator [Affinibrenneria salicis]
MDWIESSARVVDCLGTPEFAPSLIDALRAVVPFEHTVIFAYYEGRKPLALHDDFPDKKRRVMVDDYQAGPYLLDPFFRHAAACVNPCLVRLRDLAPDRFYQGEYFRNYYIQTGLAEEIGFMVNPGQGVNVVISAMRESRRFSAWEFRKLREVMPFVNAVSRRHWADLVQQFAEQPAPARGPKLVELIDKAFQNIGSNLLTPREAEIVGYILKGYSAKATSLALGISPGTVRIHKRNLYVKLRIGSQGELFSRFIRALTALE